MAIASFRLGIWCKSGKQLNGEKKSRFPEAEFEGSIWLSAFKTCYSKNIKVLYTSIFVSSTKHREM